VIRYIHLDTETTGLDKNSDEIWNISYIIDDTEGYCVERTFFLQHTAEPSAFTLADPTYRRIFVDPDTRADIIVDSPVEVIRVLSRDCSDARSGAEELLLVGARPWFDDAFLQVWRDRFGVTTPWWSHELIDIENMAFAIGGASELGKPPRLKEISEILGFQKIERTPHSAEADRILSRKFFWAMMDGKYDVQRHASAEDVLNIERAFQEAKFPGGTAANPAIPIADKLNWITEEFLEVITAFNDRKSTPELMHEIVQLGALAKAMIESHIQDDPSFPAYVSAVRAADLDRLKTPR
jgi:hypothetical protein